MKIYRAMGALAVVVAALQGAPTLAEPGFVGIYGNWCGPGHRTLPGVNALPPVDELDDACMRHDVCYAIRGDADCGCDFRLLDELRYIPYSHPEAAVRGRAIYDALSILPCAGPEAMFKPGYFMSEMANDFFNGGPPPWDVLRRFGHTSSNLY